LRNDNSSLCIRRGVGRRIEHRTQLLFNTQTSISSLIQTPMHTGWGADDCSAPVNQCVLNPCDPEGTLFCEELPKGFKCVCQHGYMGRLCQIPRSHCVDGLCHRGSKCVDLPRGFKCHCLPGKLITRNKETGRVILMGRVCVLGMCVAL
jgi:hypothetical protein